LCEPRCESIPEPESFERLSRVFPGGHARCFRDGEAAAAERRKHAVPVGRIDRFQRRCRRRDQYQRIAHEYEARRRFDQLAILQVIHPLVVGGNEDVRRRTLLDLFRERRTRRIRNDDLQMPGGFPGTLDAVEALLEAGGSENREQMPGGHGRRAAEQHR
jgi:hypothetical protein